MAHRDGSQKRVSQLNDEPLAADNQVDCVYSLAYQMFNVVRVIKDIYIYYCEIFRNLSKLFLELVISEF